MVDASQTTMTHATYDALLFRLSEIALKRSHRLLEQTAPLVKGIEGGSVIGAHALPVGERAAPGRPERKPDGRHLRGRRGRHAAGERARSSL